MLSHSRLQCGVNTTFMCTGKPKILCDLLYSIILLIEAAWNRIHNVSGMLVCGFVWATSFVSAFCEAWSHGVKGKLTELYSLQYFFCPRNILQISFNRHVTYQNRVLVLLPAKLGQRFFTQMHSVCTEHT